MARSYGKDSKRPARARPPTRSNAAAIPCLLLMVGALVLISLLFYAILKSGS